MESLWERETRLQASVSALRHVLNDANGMQRQRLSEELTRAEASLYAFYEETGHLIVRRNTHVQQGADIRGTEESDSVHSETRVYTEDHVGGGCITGSTDNNTEGRRIGGND